MRISDWSSDVCSSDLRPAVRASQAASGAASSDGRNCPADGTRGSPSRPVLPATVGRRGWLYSKSLIWLSTTAPFSSITKDREGVVEGKSVSVSVDLSGRRVIKKKKYNTYKHTL